MKKWIIKILLKFFKPRLVIIFGVYAKDETREMTAAVLAKRHRVVSASAHGLEEALWRAVGGMGGIMLGLFTRRRTFPEVCVVSSHPREEDYLAIREILDVYAAVVTPVGDIPSFSDLFAGEEREASAYLKEFKTFFPGTFLILSYDDETVRNLDEKTNIRRYTYGISEYSDIYAQEIRHHLDKDSQSGGVHAKVYMDGSVIPFRVPNALGKRHLYAALAAIGVASRFEMNIVEAIEGMSKYQAPAGSGRIFPGIKNSALIDASLHATPFLIREMVEIVEGL